MSRVPFGNPLEPGSGLALTLRELHDGYADLIELIVHLPGIAGLTPYFQVRRASELQSTLCRALRLSGSVDGPGLFSVSLSTGESLETSASIAGTRAAGFQNALFLPQPGGPMGYWQGPGGILEIHGGSEIDGQSSPGALAAAVAAEIARGDPAIAYLSLEKLKGLGDGDVARLTSHLGEAVAAEIAAGRIYSIPPSALHRQSGWQYGYVALRVDGQIGDGPDDQTEAFIAGLRDAGIPSSYAVRTGDDLDVFAALRDTAVSDVFAATPVIGLDDLPKGDEANAIAERLEEFSKRLGSPIACVTAPSEDPRLLVEAGAAGAAAIGLLCGAPSSFVGLDGDGLLHLPAPRCLTAESVAGVVADIAQAAGPRQDMLVAIEPTAIATQEARKALAGIFFALAKMPESRFVTVEEYRRRVMPTDPAFDLLRAAKSGALLAPPASDVVEPAERAELLRDAELAWTYIAGLTDPQTGLVPGTASLDDEGLTAWRFATMWDVASAVLGMMSAHSLGLIDTAEFMERVALALAHIADTTSSGLRLPLAAVSTDGTSAGADGYDASDAGRLLIALKLLDTYAGGALETGRLVERWDLGGTLIGGRLHSLENGAFVDVHDFGLHQLRSAWLRRLGLHGRAGVSAPLGYGCR